MPQKKKKKPKPPADELERIPNMKRAIEDARKKGKPLKGLELQLKELEEKFDLSGIKAAPPQEKKKPKPKPKPPTPPPPEPETTDEETEEEEVYDRSKVKVIKGIGRNLKEIWLDYMEYRNGGDPYTEADQKFELEQFEEIEKQFFEAKETRTDPSNSAAVQAKAGATQSRIRNDIKQEIKDVGEGMKKLYQKLTPQLFRAYEDKKPSSQAAIDKILNK